MDVGRARTRNWMDGSLFLFAGAVVAPKLIHCRGGGGGRSSSFLCRF